MATSASYADSSSFATSASQASTASALNPVTSIYVNEIYPTTGNSANRIFTENSQLGFGGIGDTVIYTSISDINLYAGAGTRAVKVTGSLGVSNGITGSLFGTSSFADNATSASYSSTAQQATSASFASTASFVTLAQTASFANNATSASYSSTAQQATSASFASTAAQVNNALSFGTGLTGGSYNGSTAVTTAISGAAALSSNVLTKWTGTGLANSNITDTGTQVQIGSGASGGVSVAAGGINVTGNSIFNSNLTISGDLTVAGTASFTNTDNLTIKDKFILINSGSSTLADSGWITQYNAAGSGSAFYLEAASTGDYGRFAVAYDVIGTSTALTVDQFVVTAKTAAGAPSADPTWGGATNGYGNMFVNSSNGDIYIYS